MGKCESCNLKPAIVARPRLDNSGDADRLCATCALRLSLQSLTNLVGSEFELKCQLCNQQLATELRAVGFVAVCLCPGCDAQVQGTLESTADDVKRWQLQMRMVHAQESIAQAVTPMEDEDDSSLLDRLDRIAEGQEVLCAAVGHVAKLIENKL